MEPIGLARDAIELRPYDDQWPSLFEAERANLRRRLGSELVAIEHIGSTAVPGLSAKPVIDIQATVASLADAPRLLGALSELGYLYMPERVYASRWFLPKGPAHRRTHYLSLVQENTSEASLRIRFRDALRANSVRCREYEALKRDLLRLHPGDRPSYTAGKSAFIERVLAEAEGAPS